MPEPKTSRPEQPFDLDSMLNEALSLHDQQNLEQAESWYRQILLLSPEHFTALHGLGILLRQRGEFAAAVHLLQDAVRLQPRSALAHLNLGLAYWNLVRPEEAVVQYRYSLMLRPDNPDALLNLAAALADLHQLEEALAVLDRLLVLQPDSANAHLNRGIALKELAHYEEALESLDQALSLAPDLAAAYWAKGDVLHALECPDEAIKSLKKAFNLKPAYAAGAWINHGHSLARQGRFEEALEAYGNALKLNPGLSDAPIYRAEILLELHRPQEALDGLERARSICPAQASLLLQRGIVLMHLHRLEEAQTCFEQALAFPPGPGGEQLTPSERLDLITVCERALARKFFLHRQPNR